MAGRPHVGRTRGHTVRRETCRAKPRFSHHCGSSVPLKFPRGYLSNTKEISDGMLTNVKGVNGGLGWLASTARPDMAAPHSITPSGYDGRSPQLISEVNAAVKQCHAVPITITIWPIPFAELRWTTFTDSVSTQGSDWDTNRVG